MSSPSGKTLSLRARSTPSDSYHREMLQRQKKLDNSLIDHASQLFAEFQFSTEELVGLKVPLPFVDLLAKGGRLTDREVKLVDVGFQEALANALDHGNLELDSSLKEELDTDGIDRYSSQKKLRIKDPMFGSRRIKLSFEVKDAEFIIRIIDEGQGFLPQEEDTPTLRRDTAEELLPHGRGLSLIMKAFDAVRFRQWGREIEMVKKLIPVS